MTLKALPAIRKKRGWNLGIKRYVYRLKAVGPFHVSVRQHEDEDEKQDEPWSGGGDDGL